MTVRIPWQLLNLLYAVLLSCLFASTSQAQKKEDYLTDAEVEKLREAQEPHARIKVLAELLENRLDKAKALKDPGAVKPKPVEPKEGKKKGGRSKEAPEPEPEKAAESASPRSFAAWMQQYLQCLEELESNLENFSSVPMDPKAYLKSLNKMDESLQEQSRWVSQLSGKLDPAEKKLVDEVSDVLREATNQLKTAIDDAQERIKLLKETQKAKSSRK
jgi:hypothetical protein